MNIADFSVTVNGREIPVFQLLQWKHAIPLEGIGLRHSSRRSVCAHAKRMLGLPPRLRREKVVSILTQMLDGVEQARDTGKQPDDIVY